MNKNYKLVICDMDGTLLKTNHTISEYSKQVISEVKKKGVTIIIATGRFYLDAKFFKEQLGLKSFLVTSNGAIAHNPNDEEIISEYISENLVNRIIDFEVDTEKYHRNIYRNNEWYIEYKIDGLDEFHSESGFQYIIEDFNKFKNKKITKFFYLGEAEEIEILEKRLKENFSNELTITLSSPFCLELLKKDANKGTALKKLLDNLKISPEETIAFGDGLNDYDMLKLVGKGFIMANANPRLIEKLSDFEIIGNCNDDSVARKLKEIFL